MGLTFNYCVFNTLGLVLVVLSISELIFLLLYDVSEGMHSLTVFFL